MRRCPGRVTVLLPLPVQVHRLLGNPAFREAAASARPQSRFSRSGDDGGDVDAVRHALRLQV